MSMYHDTLLAKVGQSDPKYKPLIPSSPHTRYTRAWCDKDVRYKWFARALELVRFTELLVEMGLRRKVSRKTRWKGIILLEAVKCVSAFMSVHRISICSSEHCFVSPCCVSHDALCFHLLFPSASLILKIFPPGRKLHRLRWLRRPLRLRLPLLPNT